MRDQDEKNQENVLLKFMSKAEKIEHVAQNLEDLLVDLKNIIVEESKKQNFINPIVQPKIHIKDQKYGSLLLTGRDDWDFFEVLNIYRHAYVSEKVLRKKEFKGMKVHSLNLSQSGKGNDDIELKDNQGNSHIFEVYGGRNRTASDRKRRKCRKDENSYFACFGTVHIPESEVDDVICIPTQSPFDKKRVF